MNCEIYGNETDHESHESHESENLCSVVLLNIKERKKMEKGIMPAFTEAKYNKNSCDSCDS